MNTEMQESCNRELDRLLQEASEIIFANLSLLDGRTYAMSSLDRVDQQRIAALSSSLLALSESFAREVRGGLCSYVTVSMERGFLVTVRVPTEPGRYTLSLFVDNSANLAMALRWALDAAKKLTTLLVSI
ncbi:MAG TPA: roadblock/LC7 domain-containing protein [Rhodanobacter sp.]|nr:roadblock/LC7 domain-containing protein [Rhodanobacter sp.]